MKTVALRQAGLSLIELMIAILLGALILAGTVMLFQQSKASSVQDEQIARMQENGRYALRLLAREMSMMGYLGGLLDSSVITNNYAVGTDCNGGWMQAYANLMEITDNVAAGASPYTCVLEADITDLTDVIGLKRVADQPDITVDEFGVVTGTVTTDAVYLKTNTSVATMYDAANTGDDGPGSVPNPNSIYQYLPQVIYVRDWSVTAGDGIPALVRESLVLDDMTSEVLVEGIENLQLEFGIDGADPDLSPDYYTAAPTAAQLRDAVTARVFLLLRSIDPVLGYVNDKSYNLGGQAVAAANDNFYRRVYSTTIQLRNADKLKLYAIN